ncbi:MAG: purple acid phosphatase family protein [Candidatus Helarchaeota archaeon]
MKKEPIIVAIKKSVLFCLILLIVYAALFLNSIGPWLMTKNLKYPLLTFIGDTKTSMGISFETPVKCKATIYYGENTSLMEVPLTETSARMIHKFNLTGLRPSTEYYYLINSTTVNYDFMNKIFHFKTAPNASLSLPVRFAVFGDTRPDIWGNTQHSYIISKMITHNPTFIMNVGDIVMGPSYANEWDRFYYETYQCTLHGIPYMVTMGNHEEHEGPGGMEDKGRTYYKYMHFPDTNFYYHFNYSNIMVISLNIADPDNITQAQINWLNNTLFEANKSSDIDWIFVFSHYPPYSSTENTPSIINKIVPLIKLYKVDIYFSAHHHHYERIIKDGITYIITGGGGAETDLYLQPSEWTVTKAIAFQYCIIDITNKTLNFKCYNQDGITILDQFNLTSWRNP